MLSPQNFQLIYSFAYLCSCQYCFSKSLDLKVKSVSRLFSPVRDNLNMVPKTQKSVLMCNF